MSTSREQRLVEFREAVLAGRREETSDLLFRILYRLPATMQIELVRYMTSRFLPVFRAHHPEDTYEVAAPAMVLDDLARYYQEHEQGLPDEPENSFGGDPSFRYALYALLRAWTYAQQGDLPRVTPACCTGLIWAIAARANNVWHADDPEAVRAWEENDWETLAGRDVHDNMAAQAVRKREWLIVADWLEAQGVVEFPISEDAAERETWFAWWKDRECNL